eukprot:7067390-Prymnesium_polylepis.1
MLRRAQSPAARQDPTGCVGHSCWQHGLGLSRAQLPAAWFSGYVGHGRRQHGSRAASGTVAGSRIPRSGSPRVLPRREA